MSSRDSPQSPGGKPTVEFMVRPELKEEIEDAAWANRMTKSEVMRAITREGIGRLDDILETDDGSVQPSETEA